MAWTNDDTVCTILYSLLTGKLEQIDQNVIFDNAGAVAMSQLVFFNALASPDIIRQAATSLASTLDSTFTQGYLAQYTGGQNQQLAVNSIASTLADAQNTVETLSNTVASLYQFLD